MAVRKRKSRRDLDKERFWRQTIARQLKSGLSREEFCKREGLNLNTFCTWVHIIRRRDAERVEESRKRPSEVSFWLEDEDEDEDEEDEPPNPPVRGRPKSKPFVPVSPLVIYDATASETIEQEAVAEVRFGKATISVFRGADQATLRSLLTVCKEFCD